MFTDALLCVLRSARSVAVFTGAGISAESGVPTFRGEGGIWKKFRPEELATFEAFIRNPELVWEWYNHRRAIIASVMPNAGHRAIADMEGRHDRFAVITQNIDNLHRRAGSRKVLELHGNIERNYCSQCRRPWAAEEESVPAVLPPRCRACGGLVRPDVVWFGELLPEDAWEESVAAATEAEVFFSVGTSSVVYPAASLPLIAKQAGAYVVEVNVERTDFSPQANEVILGAAGTVLPRLVEMAYGSPES